MEALIAQADAIRPVQKQNKRRSFSGSGPSNATTKHKKSHPSSKDHASSSSKVTVQDSKTLTSIQSSTSLPRSLQSKDPLPKGIKTHGHIKNRKLRLELDKRAEHTARAKALREDAELLTEATGTDAGRIETEGELECTWRLGQSDIGRVVGSEAARQQKEYKLDGGPYRARYTRNGRHLAIVGRLGHVASFDWQTGAMHAELQLRETCRDITYLHDQSFFAVAQKKYVYIYDKNGVEIHKLSNHVEPERLEFLPYHWLLASVGHAGHLKYQDTSTGQLVAAHRTGNGSATALAQNNHTAVIHVGHSSGRVTLWTPNQGHAAVTLQAHRGGVTGISIDPSDGGKYVATTGVDGEVKVWDIRTWNIVRQWTSRGGGGEVEWSAKGTLAVASGGTVNTYNSPHVHTPFPSNTKSPPPLYLTHPIPSRPLTALRFCPFTDMLTIGHSKGLSSILIPGSGEPHFDSSEADPYENSRRRREREVRGLLDKLSPELITVNGPAPGSLAPTPKLTLPGGEGKIPEVPFAQMPRMDRLKVAGKYDLTEEPESDEEIDGDEKDDGKMESAMGKGAEKKELKKSVKNKMRGKNKSMKRYLRKHRRNVIDPQTVAIREKLEKQRAERQREKAISQGVDPDASRKPSALDRFRRDKK